jgi:DNA-binding GntR family transcriptional regulator
MKKRRSSIQDHIRARDRIPDEVLKEIFPRRLNRYEASEKVYSHLKQKILSGKLKKG